jgi:hypothetical protein
LTSVARALSTSNAIGAASPFMRLTVGVQKRAVLTSSPRIGSERRPAPESAACHEQAGSTAT